MKVGQTGVRRARGVLMCLAVAGLGVGVSACGSGSASSSQSASSSGATATGSAGTGSSTSGKLQTITMAYTAPVADQLMPVLGQEAGIFKKYGLNVKVTYLTASEADSGLASGRIQMAVFAAPEPEVLNGSGQNIQWVAEWEKHADLFLYGRSGVTSVKDLAGKPVGETSAGSTTAELESISLAQAGVLSSAHIEPLGSVGAMDSAFESGAIDACILSPPNNTAFAGKVPGFKLLVNYKTSLPWVGGGMAAEHSWLASHESEAVDMMKGIVASEKYWEQNQPAAVKAIVKLAHSTQTDATAAYEGSTGIMKASGSPAPSLSLEASMLKSLGLVQSSVKKVQAPAVVDATPMQSALGQ